MKYDRAKAKNNAPPERKFSDNSEFCPSTTANFSNTLLKLQSSIGNKALSGMLQAKLKLGKSNDPLEQEADKTAEEISGKLNVPNNNLTDARLESSSTSAAKNISSASSAGNIEVDSKTQERINHAKNQPGQSLSGHEQRYFESNLGRKLDHVRVHTGTEASEAADSINAKAFTVGNDIFFGEYQYNTQTKEGAGLLAHELTHVVQQGNSQSIQRQTANEEKKPDINYAKAEKANKEYARLLKWDTRLEEINKDWSKLWNAEEYNAFADAVALFQIQQSYSEKSVDGILGPATWDRLRPIGEVIADRDVDKDESLYTCTIASEERLKEGYKRATGENLVPQDKRSTFNSILQSIPSEMPGIDEKYRGTGAAGALAYLGKGELVSEEDIWEDKILKPGAPLQVWKKESDYERVKSGQNILSFGTSFIFVEYVGSDKIKVRHFNTTETHKRSDYEVWIGANVNERKE